MTNWVNVEGTKFKVCCLLEVVHPLHFKHILDAYTEMVPSKVFYAYATT